LAAIESKRPDLARFEATDIQNQEELQTIDLVFKATGKNKDYARGFAESVSLKKSHKG